MAKVFRDKRSTKICKNICYTYGGQQDIDFIKKICPKNVEKCCKKMMKKHYLHKYIVVSYYLGYRKTFTEHYVTENFNKL